MPDHTTQDPAQEIPYGYCHCGCGQRTKIIKETSSEKGWIKGEPLRFVNGHNGRKHFPPPVEKLCECGCGEPAPISQDTDPKRGYVRGQPMRFIVGHQNRLRVYPSAEERFWQKVDKRGPNECWEWKASTAHGYGQLKDGTGMVMTHRFSYELHFGEIPDNLWVLHRCDNPLCVNPNHLFLGTHQDNMKDMAQKNRARRTPTIFGETHHSARLTSDQILEIRQLHASGELQQSLAEKYGVLQTTISDIVRRRTWKHILST